jgi:glucans biosynthesis protein C
VAFRPLPLPAIAKIPLVLGVSVVILVATYDLFVRSTWIGALLNGRRYDTSMIRNRRYSCVPA